MAAQTQNTAKKSSIVTRLNQILCLGLLVLSLSACAGTKERIDQIGKAPALSPIEDPTQKADYKKVSLPMPPTIEETAKSNSNSLWQANRQGFFKDQRAHQIGDILTVLIEIKDDAELENTTERSRNNTENAALPNFLGLESKLGKILPQAVTPSSLVDMNSSSGVNGTGKVERDEEVNFKVAAMIAQVLPNGNLVINGRQEVRVNHEVRELLVAGVIRPEDITNTNTISYDKIAEARISYGGRGLISDVQKPRYGQEFFDIVYPF